MRGELGPGKPVDLFIISSKSGDRGMLSKPVPGRGGTQDGWNPFQEKAASPGSSFGVSPAEAGR